MSSISQSLNERLIPLDFKSVLSIPESHQWTLSTDDRIANLNPSESESLPLIDLSHSNARSLIRQASEEWGAFQVTNHGVPSSLLRQLDLQTHLLFSLPTHHKLTTLRPPHGVTGYGMPRISIFYPKLMWSEGFSIMGSPADHASQLWPHQPQQQETFW